MAYVNDNFAEHLAPHKLSPSKCLPVDAAHESGRGKNDEGEMAASQHATHHDIISPLALGSLGTCGACKDAEMIQWRLVARRSRVVAHGRGSRDERTQGTNCDRSHTSVYRGS